MANEFKSATSSAVITFKKTTVPRVKNPPSSKMVNAAITALQEKKGSSLVAIKKYIATTYNIDIEKKALFIKKYLKTSVANGDLIQTTGKGATGSFKLAAKAKPKVIKVKPKDEGKYVKIKIVKPKKIAAISENSKKVAASKIKNPASPTNTLAIKKTIITKKSVKLQTSEPKSHKPKKSPMKKGLNK